jgi:putative transposase
VGRRDGQSALGGDLVGPNPTDRGKNGTKRSVLVDGGGGPLSVVLAGANVNDFKLLRATLEGVVVARPVCVQHLCMDKGYDYAEGELESLINGYRPHIRRIGEEKLDSRGRKTRKARRWVVERTLAWLSKCRALLVRHEKKASNYLGLFELACALIWFRRYRQLTVLG